MSRHADWYNIVFFTDFNAAVTSCAAPSFLLQASVHDTIGLSTFAIVVIVLVCCLASVALGAAVLRPWTPVPTPDSERLNIPHEQAAYMRSVGGANLRRIYLALNGGRPQRPDAGVCDTLQRLPSFWWLACDVTQNIVC